MSSTHIVAIDRTEDLFSLLMKDFPNDSVYHLDPAITPQVQDCDLPKAEIVVLNLSSLCLPETALITRRMTALNPGCSVVCTLSGEDRKLPDGVWSTVDSTLLLAFGAKHLFDTISELISRSLRIRQTIRLENENLKLKKEIRDLETIGDVSRSVTSALLIEEILAEILADIRNALGLERVLLGLVNSEKKIEEVKVSIGVPDSDHKRVWDITATDFIWKSILDCRKPVLLDASEHPSLPHFVRETFAGEFVKAPIVVKDQIIGTIMGSRSSAPLGETDLKLLQIFVQYAGVALENGRLYRDVIRSEEELKKAQEQSLAAEKLAVIGQFAISINHEINNPLCNISLINQILKHELTKRAPDLLKRLEGIDESVARIQKVAEGVTRIKNASPTEYLPNQLMIELK